MILLNCSVDIVCCIVLFKGWIELELLGWWSRQAMLYMFLL